MIVDQALYIHGERVPCDDLSTGLQQLRREEDNGNFLWVGLKDPTAEEFNDVNEELGLHRLAIEDAVLGRQRVKVELYGENVLVVVLRPIRYIEETSDIVSGELMVIVGDHFVVTARRGAVSPLDGVRQRLESEPGLLQRGPQAALYTILDRIVDDYVAIDAEVQADVEDMENDFFADGEVDTSAIYRLKREILEFKRAVAPLAPQVRWLYKAPDAHVSDDELQLLYRDVVDHAQGVVDHIDGYDRLLSDILNAHLSLIGVQQNEVAARQNEDMRKISAWVAIAAVPTMIAGIYGMNFTFMPELTASFAVNGHEFYYGYFVIMAFMIAVSVSLHRAFRRSGWL